MSKEHDKKISVVINTYNAEEFLAQTLDSVRSFDEIVICDMHSTDSTLQIAEQYGCKIVFHRKEPIVEPARNFAIQSATYNWILLLDADETITKEMKTYLQDFISRAHTYKAIRMARRNFFMGRFMHGSYPDRIIRFFRKDAVHWGAHVHAIPEIDGDIYNLTTTEPKLAINHLPQESVETIIAKLNRYSSESVIHKQKKYSIFALFTKPFFHFFKPYILKKGFLDGKAGLIFAALKSQNALMQVLKTWEKDSKTK